MSLKEYISYSAKKNVHNKKKLELLSSIKKDIPLAPYTTLKVGGPALYLLEVSTADELLQAIQFSEDNNVPYVVLGSGANTLISDSGFKGLVIIMRMRKLSLEGTTCVAEAGVTIGQLVTQCVQRGLTGMECWAGIPGTVGGSVYGNMGLPRTVKGAVADHLTSVRIFKNNTIQSITKKECEFGYRTSIFKKTHDIILEATFLFEKTLDTAMSKEAMRTYQKKKILEQPLETPSSGCMFKNPTGKSVGRMVDEMGLKGTVCGGAEISKRHGNFIVNNGRATARDIEVLMELVKKKIKKRYTIDIEEEVQRIGFI